MSASSPDIELGVSIVTIRLRSGAAATCDRMPSMKRSNDL